MARRATEALRPRARRLACAALALLVVLVFVAAAPASAATPRPDWIHAEADRTTTEDSNLEYDCDGDHATGCTELAFRSLVQRGSGSESRAARLAERACELESGAGCALLGYLRRQGAPSASDAAAAIELLEKACGLGFAPGCFELGRAFDAGGDEVRAREAAANACRLGYAPACTGRRDDRDARETGARGGDDARKKPRAEEPASGDEKVQQDKVRCGWRGDACTRLGVRSLQGDGMPVSANLAAVYFQQGCEARSPDYEACARLGELYQEGKGVERNVEQARKYLKLGCSYKLRDACERLEALAKPRSSRPSNLDAWCDPDDTSCGPARSQHEREVDRLAGGCNRGSAEECVKLGAKLVQPGPDRDPERAAGLLEKGCDAGVGMGCSILGWLYQNGQGVEKDPARAMELYRKACEGGYAHGCSMQGELYLRGIGVAKDAQRALELGERACEGQCYDGCGLAGYILLSPDLGARDAARGLELLDRGCTGGHFQSCAFRGFAIFYGQGAPADRRKGLELLRKACDGDDPSGCRLLGAALAESASAAEREEAWSAYDKACRMKDAGSCEKRDRVRRK
jgi:TPR repeat protein